MLEAIQSYVPQSTLASGILQTEVQGLISQPDVRSTEDVQPFRCSAREPGLQTGYLAAKAYTQSGNTEEGPPHGSPSLEHHCIWLPAGHLYTAGIGTAMRADAMRGRAFISAQGSFRLRPWTSPLFCRFLDSARIYPLHLPVCCAAFRSSQAVFSSCTWRCALLISAQRRALPSSQALPKAPCCR